jgi:hypothetical protein
MFLNLLLYRGRQLVHMIRDADAVSFQFSFGNSLMACARSRVIFGCRKEEKFRAYAGEAVPADHIDSTSNQMTCLYQYQ